MEVGRAQYYGKSALGQIEIAIGKILAPLLGKRQGWHEHALDAGNSSGARALHEDFGHPERDRVFFARTVGKAKNDHVPLKGRGVRVLGVFEGHRVRGFELVEDLLFDGQRIEYRRGGFDDFLFGGGDGLAVELGNNALRLFCGKVLFFQKIGKYRESRRDVISRPRSLGSRIDFFFMIIEIRLRLFYEYGIFGRAGIDLVHGETIRGGFNITTRVANRSNFFGVFTLAGNGPDTYTAGRYLFLACL
jgi:hypothetical protein